jgi:hypothetical protein
VFRSFTKIEIHVYYLNRLEERKIVPKGLAFILAKLKKL